MLFNPNKITLGFKRRRENAGKSIIFARIGKVIPREIGNIYR
jgi:hypothetical protein